MTGDTKPASIKEVNRLMAPLHRALERKKEGKKLIVKHKGPREVHYETRMYSGGKGTKTEKRHMGRELGYRVHPMIQES